MAEIGEIRQRPRVVREAHRMVVTKVTKKWVHWENPDFTNPDGSHPSGQMIHRLWEEYAKSKPRKGKVKRK